LESDVIDPRPTVKSVIASQLPIGERVVSVAPDQGVVAGDGEKRVGTGAAEQHIVAAPSPFASKVIEWVQEVGTCFAVNEVVLVSSRQVVLSVASTDSIPARPA
jgi:hypothetical protein